MSLLRIFVTVVSLHAALGQDQCGVTVGCFRAPEGCGLDDCDFIVTWRPQQDVVDFELSVLYNAAVRYGAVGFSLDGFMQDDSVTDCIYNPDSASVTIQQSWNLLYDNEVLQDTQLGLSPEGQGGGLQEERLECIFSRYITPALFSPDSPELNRVVNLTTPHHILVSKGNIDDNDLKEYHEARYASPEPFLLTDVTSGDNGPARGRKTVKNLSIETNNLVNNVH